MSESGATRGWPFSGAGAGLRPVPPCSIYEASLWLVLNWLRSPIASMLATSYNGEYFV